MEKKKPAVWDCDSSLYDSFELKSFKRQLDSAIASRSLSMPRISVAPGDKKAPAAASSATYAKDQASSGRPAKRISRSIQKLIKAVLFRKKPQRKGAVEDKAAVAAAPAGFMLDDDFSSRDVMWVGVGGLETILEVPEKAGCGGDDGTPESGWQAVRKTVSERFTGRVGLFR